MLNKDYFDTFKDSLIPSNRDWNYFVDWEKVNRKTQSLSNEIKELESLKDSPILINEVYGLLCKSEKIVELISLLIAVRSKKNSLDIIDVSDSYEFNNVKFELKSEFFINNEQIALDFLSESGIIDLISKSKDLYSVVLGIEIGLDSNARKNRGGQYMESLIEDILKNLYSLREGVDYLTQARAAKVKQEWDIDLSVDKRTRAPDFIIKGKEKLIWMETNFYSVGGSKLKATCGEYIGLDKYCKKNNLNFLWVTDGYGLNTALKPLSEAYKEIDYLWNLNMFSDGRLNELINFSDG